MESASESNLPLMNVEHRSFSPKRSTQVCDDKRVSSVRGQSRNNRNPRRDRVLQSRSHQRRNGSPSHRRSRSPYYKRSRSPLRNRSRSPFRGRGRPFFQGGSRTVYRGHFRGSYRGRIRGSWYPRHSPNGRRSVSPRRDRRWDRNSGRRFHRENSRESREDEREDFEEENYSPRSSDYASEEDVEGRFEYDEHDAEEDISERYEEEEMHEETLPKDTEALVNKDIGFFTGDSNDLSVRDWLKQIEGCASRNNWDDKTKIFHMTAKLIGFARKWYLSLDTDNDFAWNEWKEKLTRAFPCNEDFYEQLQQMMQRRKLETETFSKYFCHKVVLLNACDIAGKRAVSCILGGIDNQDLVAEAKRQNFEKAEQLFEFLCAGTDGADEQAFEAPPIAHRTGQVSKSVVYCKHCRKRGHCESQCWHVPISCKYCKRKGHDISDCRFLQQKAKEEEEWMKLAEAAGNIISDPPTDLNTSAETDPNPAPVPTVETAAPPISVVKSETDSFSATDSHPEPVTLSSVPAPEAGVNPDQETKGDRIQEQEPKEEVKPRKLRVRRRPGGGKKPLIDDKELAVYNPALRCIHCSQTGHQVAECPVLTFNELSTEQIMFGVFQCTRVFKKFFMEVLVNGAALRGYVDRKSEHVTIRQQDALRLGLPVRKEYRMIRGAGGCTISTHGEVEVQLKVDLAEGTVLAYVVPDHIQRIAIIVGNSFLDLPHVYLDTLGEKARVRKYGTFSPMLAQQTVTAQRLSAQKPVPQAGEFNPSDFF